jgi:hypothetical protein
MAKLAYLASFHGSVHDLEKLGPAESKICPLEGQHWSLLDGRKTCSTRLAASPQVPPQYNNSLSASLSLDKFGTRYLSWIRMTCTPPTADDTDWWDAAKQRTAKLLRKALGSVTLLIPWMFGNTGTHASSTVRGPQRVT